VECALKVCVLKHVLNTGVIFTDRKFVEKCWTHNIDDLVKAAGLEVERGQEMAANPARESNWVTVRRWSEVARYNLTTRTDAEELYNAIADPTNGVLPWIKSRW
jgi:hypothetical protein